MKKILLIGLAVAMVMVPMALPAQVEPVGGSMTIGGHIDFVTRYSAEDLDDPDPNEVYWPGYETYNMEAAILYVMGNVGDDISYAIGYALAMPDYEGFGATPVGVATLLDAKIAWSITESMVLNMGRYIPHTSMTNQPHQLKVHHTINPPMMILPATMIEDTIGTGAVTLIPLPRYQTGIGLEAMFGPATITWDFFDGHQNVGGEVVSDTLSDNDKCKGGVLKAAVDTGNLHAGLWYLQERADLTGAVADMGPITINFDSDNDLTQWGLELAYNSERIIAALEYMTSALDVMDDDYPVLNQLTYYLLVGANIGPIQAVLRYDYAEAGFDQFIDEYWDEIGLGSLDEDELFDQMVIWTLGVNYSLNDLTTVALNYSMLQPEVPDIEVWTGTDWEDVEYPAINELAIMVELDLL